MADRNPGQLRRTIARATVPLLGEYETLTTARIAREAGIDEADLLTVFANTEAVLQACVATLAETIAAVLNPADEVQDMAAIPTDQPLPSRLVQVIDILDAYHGRIRVGLDDLLPRGTAEAPATRPFIPHHELRSFGNSPELRRAVTRLLEPDEQRLRWPAPILAEAFIGMTFGGIRPTGPDQSPLTAEQVADLFLYGAAHHHA